MFQSWASMHYFPTSSISCWVVLVHLHKKVLWRYGTDPSLERSWKSSGERLKDVFLFGCKSQHTHEWVSSNTLFFCWFSKFLLYLHRWLLIFFAEILASHRALTHTLHRPKVLRTHTLYTRVVFKSFMCMEHWPLLCFSIINEGFDQLPGSILHMLSQFVPTWHLTSKPSHIWHVAFFPSPEEALWVTMEELPPHFSYHCRMLFSLQNLYLLVRLVKFCRFPISGWAIFNNKFHFWMWYKCFQ